MADDKEDELMNPEPQEDYEKILAQVLRLDKSAQMNLIADLTAHLNRERAEWAKRAEECH